jgi:hypothetical protein
MTKDERRTAMPESTAFIDAMREHFTIAGIRAQENGHSVSWGEHAEGVAVVPVLFQENVEAK